MNQLLDRIVTTLLRDFAPSHPVGQAVCLAVMVALLLLSALAIADTIKSSGTDTGLPPPGPRVQRLLGVPLLRRLMSLLFRSPMAPQVWVSGALVMISCALATPAILKVREAARHGQVRNNLRAIGLSMSNYHDTFLSFPHAPSTPSSETAVELTDPPPEESLLVSPL